MKKIIHYFSILLFLIIQTKAHCQNSAKFDLLMLKNQKEINCQVVEVLEDVIKYKKDTNLTGPTYSINKSEVFKIIYKNGERESFEDALETKTVAATEKPKKEIVKKEETIKKDIPKKQSVKKEVAAADEQVAGDPDNRMTLDFGLGVFKDQPEGYIIPYFYSSNDIAFWNNKEFGFGTLMTSYDSYIETKVANIKIKSDISNLTLGVRCNYYFNKILNMDPKHQHLYAGISIAYSTLTTRTSSNTSSIPSGEASASDTNFFFQAGYKIFYGKHFGLNAELNFRSGTAFRLGICYRIWPLNNYVK